MYVIYLVGVIYYKYVWWGWRCDGVDVAVIAAAVRYPTVGPTAMIFLRMGWAVGVLSWALLLLKFIAWDIAFLISPKYCVIVQNLL